jgi:hypothetical protein
MAHSSRVVDSSDRLCGWEAVAEYSGGTSEGSVMGHAALGVSVSIERSLDEVEKCSFFLLFHL